MVSGNTVSLEMTGAVPGADAYLLLQVFGALPGTNLPVPCGGNSFNLGPLGTIVFWVNLNDPNTLILGPFPTGDGCVHLDFPLPLGLGGIVVHAQWGAVFAPGGLASVIQLNEGAKIVLG